MPQQREHPYIWATWLPRLLTSENSCEWAVWFKAHYQGWDRAPSDFDQSAWIRKHTALLNEQKADREDRGQIVRVENQNTFRLHGRTATLSGRPDLIAAQGDDVVVIDVKSGRERPSHRAQMMIYMYAIPQALPRFRNAKIAGEIIYPSGARRVPGRSVNQDFVQQLSSLIQKLAAEKPPGRVPSIGECRFCDITAQDCPERIDERHEPQGANTDDF